MHITIIGRATDAPELRFTQAGKAVAQLTVAENHRKKDGDSWVDDGTTFWRVQVWEQQAENIAESVNRGDTLIVVGETKTRTFEKKDGEKGQAFEVRAEHIGPSLRYATAKVNKVERGAAKVPAGGAAGDDPWSTGSAPF